MSPSVEYRPNSPLVPAMLVEYEEKRLCHVQIVSPYQDPCPAGLALTSEGISHEVFTVAPSSAYEDADTYKYVDCLADLWDAGEGFINLEHDVVSWPGALQELWDCEHPWCRFQYPVLPPPRMSDGIGCMKFGKEILSAVPCDSWMDLAWWDLDGQISSAIKGFGYEVHTHLPGVAHVRRTHAA